MSDYVQDRDVQAVLEIYERMLVEKCFPDIRVSRGHSRSWVWGHRGLIASRCEGLLPLECRVSHKVRSFSCIVFYRGNKNDALFPLLEYLYTGDVSFERMDRDAITALQSDAERLQLGDLKRMCELHLDDEKPNSYAKAYCTLLRDLETLYTEMPYWDVELLVTDGTAFKCHRAVLEAASSKLGKLVRGKWRSKVAMDHITSGALRAALKYLYYGDSNFGEFQARALLPWAAAFEILRLVEHCKVLVGEDAQVLLEKKVIYQDALRKIEQKASTCIVS